MEAKRRFLEDLVCELGIKPEDRQKFERTFNEMWERNIQPVFDRHREQRHEQMVAAQSWQPHEWGYD